MAPRPDAHTGSYSGLGPKTVAGGMIIAIVGEILAARHIADPLRWLAFLAIKCPLGLLGFSCPTCDPGRSVVAALSRR